MKPKPCGSIFWSPVKPGIFLLTLLLWAGGLLEVFAQTEGEHTGFRIWSSTAGTEVEAQFIGIEFDKVLLHTRDGRTIRVPIHLLSPQDQQLAREQHRVVPASRSGNNVIRVDPEPQQQMIYGMDFERLWHLGALRDLDKLAELAVADCKVSYVRIAIDGAAETEEGKIDWSVYEREQFRVMRALKKANPNIKFFASPRPFSETDPEAPFTSFPLWITDFHGDKDRKNVTFHADKAADYMVRQILYLRSQGFDIAYMDIKNECCIFLRPGPLAGMAARMREQLGTEMPVVIAPSSHNPDVGKKWLEEAVKIKQTDFFDIVATHNTGMTLGPFEEFMEVAKPLGKPVWNTEMHGFDGPDDKAVANSWILFELARSGFSGINQWLSLGNTNKTHKMFRNVSRDLEVMRTYYIFRQLVNTSTGGHYLRTIPPDGIKITAAFIQDKTVTVWALNDSESTVQNVGIDLQGMHISRPLVQIHWWDPDNGREGKAATKPVPPGTGFTHDIPQDSLYCFTFEIH